MPNPTLSPQLSRGGDNVISASVAATTIGNLQGAYALTDGSALYYGVDANLGSPSDSTWHNNILAEAAWMYYKKRDDVSLDLMFGAGFGSTYIHENGLFTNDFGGGKSQYIEETSFRFLRPFIQFDYGGDIAEYQRLAVSLRGCYVHGLYFRDSIANFGYSDSTYHMTTASAPQRFFSLEWALTWKGRVFGTKGLYLVTQVQVPVFAPRRSAAAAVYTSPNASAGFEIDF